MAVFLSLTFIPTQLKAGTETSTLSTTSVTAAEAAQATVLLTRLDEINAMDKSILNLTEKRALRKEVRSIKTQLTAVGGGVYLSVGAIIIILLILLLLF